MEASRVLLVFCITFAAIIPSLSADVAEYDEVWKKRAEEARKNTMVDYIPVPEDVTQDFNVQVASAANATHNLSELDSLEVEEEVDVATNSTRRNLRQGKTIYKGACSTTNPIDRCWRCREDWASDRKRLAKCALGFGQKTTGGLAGRIYTVTSPADDPANPKPGTLRHAVIQKEPLWIIFKKNMNIKLKQELIMTGDKTIDGRGAKVHIAYGAGLTIQFVSNVIIHGIHIHHVVATNGGMIRDAVDHFGFRTRSDGDGINIFGSTRIWIDHVSMSRCTDGLIDAIEGSTAITISNSHFTHHNDAILLGASDYYSGDEKMQVTLAFNHFGQGLVQRMPRCRWGFFHVVNNDYTNWELYAIGGSKHPTIISQGNRFIAPDNVWLKKITKRDYASPEEWSKWTWRSEGDFFMNGAYFVESGNPNWKKPSQKYMIKPKPGWLATRMTLYAGAIDCVPGRKC